MTDDLTKYPEESNSNVKNDDIFENNLIKHIENIPITEETINKPMNSNDLNRFNDDNFILNKKHTYTSEPEDFLKFEVSLSQKNINPNKSVFKYTKKEIEDIIGPETKKTIPGPITTILSNFLNKKTDGKAYNTKIKYLREEKDKSHLKKIKGNYSDYRNWYNMFKDLNYLPLLDYNPLEDLSNSLPFDSVESIIKNSQIKIKRSCFVINDFKMDNKSICELSDLNQGIIYILFTLLLI